MKNHRQSDDTSKAKWVLSRRSIELRHVGADNSENDWEK